MIANKDGLGPGLISQHTISCSYIKMGGTWRGTGEVRDEESRRAGVGK